MEPSAANDKQNYRKKKLSLLEKKEERLKDKKEEEKQRKEERSQKRLSKKEKLISGTMKSIADTYTLFSAAVLIGLTATITPFPGVPLHCIPGDDISRLLFIFEVLSFCFYLVSSILAKSLELHLIGVRPSTDNATQWSWRLQSKSSWQWMIKGSLAFSLLGTLFLGLSLTMLIQLKLGLLSCGIPEAVVLVLVLAAVFVAGTYFVVRFPKMAFHYPEI